MNNLFLPAEISAFERRYLGRVNRIALLFFYAHLPLMMLVAALCGTSVVKAAAFTVLVLAGPTFALARLQNPRLVARVMAFAAMCMGGILVHVGQGPMQIEMHFYFFVLIALLAVFADPLVIIVAAVTVALHHVALYALVPASVFNYEASIWAVAVHALFVALESVGACFVARSFFDNVIGLERIVAQRTEELISRNEQMRAVLDNVAAGLVTVSVDGQLSSERSAALERWLGPSAAGETLWAYIGRSDAAAGLLLEMAWETLQDERCIVLLALEQCPRLVKAGARTLSLTVSILDDRRRALVMMADVTNEMERERLERDQKEILRLCECAVGDPAGVAEFLRETGLMVEAIALGLHGEELLRVLHTVKGNSSAFGASSVAVHCHEVESRIAEEGAIRPEDRAALRSRWSVLAGRMAALRGQQRPRLDVDPGEHAAAVASLRCGTSPGIVAESIHSWGLERAEHRLVRLAQVARGVAETLHRAELDIVVEHADLRLPDVDLARLWAALTHVVRNAVDHGIEPAEERIGAGKPPGGRIVFRARRTASAFFIEVEDDGRGIDWALVSARARALGLPTESELDLQSALSAGGISTKSKVTSLSGRGVGIAAVRAECRRVGAKLALSAGPNGGTRVCVHIPTPAAAAA